MKRCRACATIDCAPDLAAMLRTHKANIARTNEVGRGGIAVKGIMSAAAMAFT